MTPASDKMTIPPTLLRLPDLDPEASSMLQTVQTTEPERTISTPVPSPPSKPKVGLSDGLQKSSSPSSVQVLKSTTVEPAPHLPGKEPSDHSVEPMESSSLRESDSLKTVSDDSPIADANLPSDESDSWLTTFASRKTLLVLLAIVAGLAIFFPRGENSTSEQGTPLLVEESVTEPTVIPFQMERFPATRLNPPIAATPQPIAPPQKFADSSKVMPPSPVASASVPLRQPNATTIESEIASVVQQPESTIPQPPKTPWDEPDRDEPDRDESFASTAGPWNDELASAPTEQRRTYQQTLSPQSPVIDPLQAGKMKSDLAQSMVSGYGGESVVSNTNTEPPARLVNSRTPQGIFNWKKFLPPINDDSASVSSSSPGAEQNASTSTAMPEIRTSKAPVAPSFEFALPGGPKQAATDFSDSTNSLQSNPNGSPASGPEARVAMPPQSSLR